MGFLCKSAVVCWTALLILFLCRAPVRADDASLALLQQEVERLREEVGALRLAQPRSGVQQAEALEPLYDEPCDACCDPAWASGYWRANFEFAFVKPFMKESFQASEIDLFSGTQTLYGMDFQYELAPRVGLAYETASGLALEARYSLYDHDARELSLTSDPTHLLLANSVTIIFPGIIQTNDPGEVLRVNNALDLVQLDVQGSQRVELGTVATRLGAGLRYVRFQQDYEAAITDAGALEQQLTTTRNFEALGPMISGEGRRPFGNTGLAAYGSARASLLFGNKSMQRTRVDLTSAPTAPPVIAMHDADEVFGGGELAVGLEWTTSLGFTEASVRGTYESQLWTDAGAPTLGFLGLEGFHLTLALGW